MEKQEESDGIKLKLDSYAHERGQIITGLEYLSSCQLKQNIKGF